LYSGIKKSFHIIPYSLDFSLLHLKEINKSTATVIYLLYNMVCFGIPTLPILLLVYLLYLPFSWYTLPTLVMVYLLYNMVSRFSSRENQPLAKKKKKKKCVAIINT